MLAVAIVLAIAGILVFLPTIAAPPEAIHMENMHLEDLSASIDGFAKEKSFAYNDSVYKTVTDKLSLYNREEFLNGEETDYQIKALAQKYVPVFVDLCYKKFSASKWRESDLSAIRQRVDELTGLTIDNGKTEAVAGSSLTALKGIEVIIDTYDDAKSVASHTTFISVSDAKNTITAAENYRSTPYIENCTALMDELANVKEKIGISHYSYIERQVESLRNYQNIDKTEYIEQVKSVKGALQEYENNKGQYGSVAEDIHSLDTRVAELYKEALAYYSKPGISIDTNGEWNYLPTSGYSAYRIYQSASNWHISDADARMSFTIRGYSTFSFKISSKSEVAYDYVMVSLNDLPTRDVNYANTKGSSGSYKDVIFKGLDETKSYTIYVTYTKDSSGDLDEDRGYVLIPNVDGGVR